MLRKKFCRGSTCSRDGENGREIKFIKLDTKLDQSRDLYCELFKKISGMNLTRILRVDIGLEIFA